MFAVIKAGGKQYRVAANDQISIVTLQGEAGDHVAFDHVLMLSQDGVTTVGAPTVAGVTVAGEIVEQTRGDKVIAFKKRRRQNSKRKRGFRSEITIVRITDILTGGAKPAAKAKVAKADAEVAAEKPAKTAKAPKAKAEAPAAE